MIPGMPHRRHVLQNGLEPCALSAVSLPPGQSVDLDRCRPPLPSIGGRAGNDGHADREQV